MRTIGSHYAYPTRSGPCASRHGHKPPIYVLAIADMGPLQQAFNIDHKHNGSIFTHAAKYDTIGQSYSRQTKSTLMIHSSNVNVSEHFRKL